MSENETKKPSQRRGLIKAAAIFQSIYAAIEITDCATACLMALHLVKNPYPKMFFTEFQPLFDEKAVWLIPLFLFYTSLRATSAVGLWKNRLWGFWMALVVSGATLIMAPFMFPFTAAEMLMNGVLVMLLLIGYLGNRPILSSSETDRVK